jgi:hypothetical protein
MSMDMSDWREESCVCDPTVFVEYTLKRSSGIPIHERMVPDNVRFVGGAVPTTVTRFDGADVTVVFKDGSVNEANTQYDAAIPGGGTNGVVVVRIPEMVEYPDNVNVTFLSGSLHVNHEPDSVE